MTITAALDQPEYDEGDTATLTISGDLTDVVSVTVVVSGHEPAAATADARKTITVTDSDGRVWELAHRDGDTAVYTTVI